MKESKKKAGVGEGKEKREEERRKEKKKQEGTYILSQGFSEMQLHLKLR